ncbi:helix-turn-helix transcriptional regulator [Candidatus Pacearchaeota archaeon]|nr:helix-turn-helix transcriptional regulator [Candidatus Pacearchaeota archaeon]
MPFNREALKELRKRQEWSRLEFALKFSKFLEQNWPDRLKISYSENAIYLWEEGTNVPRIFEAIDPLYIFARVLGHSDLEFYVKPFGS